MGATLPFFFGVLYVGFNMMVMFTETVNCGCMRKTLPMQPMYRLGKRPTDLDTSLPVATTYVQPFMYYFASNVSSNVAQS